MPNVYKPYTKISLRASLYRVMQTYMCHRSLFYDIMKNRAKNNHFFIFRSNNLNDFLAILLICHHETYISCQSNLCQLEGLYFPSLKSYSNHSYHFPAIKLVKEYQTSHSFLESVKNLTHSWQDDHWSKTV